MPIKNDLYASMMEYDRKYAIERALRSPAEAKARQKYYEWSHKINSSDLNILKKVFQEEWPEFERLIDNKKDKDRLKRKFDIK